MRISDWSSDVCSSDRIGTGDDRHQFLERDRRAAFKLAVDHRKRRVDHFAEVMRRNIGRHADRDAARAVDEQVREARREHRRLLAARIRSEEHTSELQSLMRISYAVFCLKKKNTLTQPSVKEQHIITHYIHT